MSRLPYQRLRSLPCADKIRHQVDTITIVNLGLRYRFRAGDANAMLRVQATNLFDSYGWEVAGNNAFVYTQSRQVLARVTVDF